MAICGGLITVIAKGDVGSVKAPILQAGDAAFPDGRFVAGHPIAGREQSGPAAARADLFERANWILTPSPRTRPEAADRLAEEGIRVEVLDLRILRPLDTPTILTSVAKTHRAIVVDEGWKTGSFAAEITARIMEEGFYDLDGPVARVCSAEVPIPYAKHMEEAALPQADAIIKTIREMLQSHG